MRLRVVLTEPELDAVQKNSRVILDEGLYNELKAWIEKHYRKRLSPIDLGDPALLQEGRAALDELTTILGLGSLYDFQRL